jgi:hypothetical protein
MKMGRYGFSVMILVLWCVTLVECYRVYLTASGNPLWDGHCAGCDELHRVPFLA